MDHTLKCIHVWRTRQSSEQTLLYPDFLKSQSMTLDTNKQWNSCQRRTLLRSMNRYVCKLKDIVCASLCLLISVLICCTFFLDYAFGNSSKIARAQKRFHPSRTPTSIDRLMCIGFSGRSSLASSQSMYRRKELSAGASATLLYVSFPPSTPHWWSRQCTKWWCFSEGKEKVLNQNTDRFPHFAHYTFFCWPNRNGASYPPPAWKMAH